MDFVRRLERTFHIAYGRDSMSSETKDTLLYGLLQEGLQLELMRGPAVSGATRYQELCVAAKNEEKRLVDFKRWQQYSKQLHHQPQQPYGSKPQQSIVPSSARPRPLQPGRTDQQRDLRRSGSDPSSDGKKCFRCKRTDHFMRDCPLKKSESSGSSRQTRTQQVSTEDKPQSTLPGEEETQPLDLLFDSNEVEGVRQVKVMDTGSCCQLARVNVHGMPAYGVVDTAADISIMGGKLFSSRSCSTTQENGLPQARQSSANV